MSLRAVPSSMPVLVAPIGNEYRRDDGAGPAIAALLSAENPTVRQIRPVDPLDLLGRWDDAQLVIVIDAIRSDEPPGTVHVEELRPGKSRSSTARATSSHGVGLAGALEVATAVGCAPRKVVLVGVVGADFAQGEGLSPAVRAAVPDAARALTALIRETFPCA